MKIINKVVVCIFQMQRPRVILLFKKIHLLSLYREVYLTPKQTTLITIR